MNSHQSKYRIGQTAVFAAGLSWAALNDYVQLQRALHAVIEMSDIFERAFTRCNPLRSRLYNAVVQLHSYKVYIHFQQPVVQRIVTYNGHVVFRPL
jgi:hypothetical protein